MNLKQNIMSVDELNQDQLEELRFSYFLQLQEQTGNEALGDITEPEQIPMSNIIAHYEGIYFVDEDFFCSVK